MKKLCVIEKCWLYIWSYVKNIENVSCTKNSVHQCNGYKLFHHWCQYVFLFKYLIRTTCETTKAPDCFMQYILSLPASEMLGRVLVFHGIGTSFLNILNKFAVDALLKALTDFWDLFLLSLVIYLKNLSYDV